MKTQKPYYITTEKISVGYDGKPLIEEVEIALRKGEILTLLGPNGAGKSTILKSIARQLSLIAGTVRLDGEDMKSLTGAELSKKIPAYAEHPGRKSARPGSVSPAPDRWLWLT